MGTPQLQAARVLLVTAHPDDEAMFFAPTLHHLTQRGVEVHICCLSNGNDAGAGEVREKELLRAAAILNVPAARVSVVNDPRLQDGMANAWVPAVVAHYVQKQLQQTRCDTVITFDTRGVSGHLNHIGAHEGVRQLLQAQGRALGVQAAWQLLSECMVVKFSGPLARRWARALHQPGQLVVPGGSLLASIRAMAAHHSQWVWYRKLFVLLSSYTYVNRLRPLPVQ